MQHTFHARINRTNKNKDKHKTTRYMHAYKLKYNINRTQKQRDTNDMTQTF